MKCFELRDDTLVGGLLIDEAEGSPRINVTADGGLYLPLDPDTSRFFLLRVEKAHHVRLGAGKEMYVEFQEDGTLGPSRRNDRIAFVRIDVHAGAGGSVTLSSGGYADVFIREEVQKCFHQFPPVGIRVVGMDRVEALQKDEPWTIGAPHIEVAVMMVKGACFRVHRTGNLRQLRKDLFVEWNGFKMDVRPRKNAPESSATKEQAPRRETLLPAIGLA